MDLFTERQINFVNNYVETMRYFLKPIPPWSSGQEQDDNKPFIIMKSKTQYFVLWDNRSSSTGWKHHCTHKTAKAARSKRNDRMKAEPNLLWKAVKCVTTELK